MARRRGSLRATCGRRDRSDQAGEDADALRIAQRIQAGEHDLFDVLYDRYFDRIYGYLNSLLGPHDAEDVVQQVFLHVVEALARGLRPRKSFDGWIYKIAHNAAIDHQRSLARGRPSNPKN
jgi:DNA-directed RNA polymerase specialized sigma24 family protein